METVNFLEYLACNTHHQRGKAMPHEIRQALQTNDAALLKRMLGGNEHFADMTRVFD